jgi:hypothetical protein
VKFINLPWPSHKGRKRSYETRRKVSAAVRAYNQALWHDRFGDNVYDIYPTACADPNLSSILPGGPQFVTRQWHRSVFRFDPDLDS